MNTKQQLEIDFEPGLTERFPEFMDCVKASVYGCRRQFKVIAADLDMSSSKLSRMFADNPDDKLNFPLKLLPDLMKATGDVTPIYWLVETFLEGSDAKQQRAVAELLDAAARKKDLPALQESGDRGMNRQNSIR